MAPAPRRVAGVAVIVLAGLFAPSARADVPFASTPAVVSADEGRIVAAHRAAPDPADGSWGMRRREARERARRRACASLHAALDDILARTAASPAEVQALHRVVEARCETIGVRPTIDGGAVVQVAVTFDALRAAADPEGAPW